MSPPQHSNEVVINSSEDELICTASISMNKGSGATGKGSSSDLSNEGKLISVFSGTMKADQVRCIFELSSYDYEATMECLHAGLTGDTILKLTKTMYGEFPFTKVHVDEDEKWCDLVSFYKAPSLDPRLHRLRICLNGQPPMDTGGVRRDLYTSVYKEFADNTHVKLFDGPPNYLKPLYSVQARSSGLFKVLGTMVGHSLVQDALGFPHFSPLCFRYIPVAVREDEAMQHVSLCDVGSDTVDFISKVK